MTAEPSAPNLDPLLRVGQLAEQSGKTVRAIHFYEELGLLTPSRRTKGGFRLYDHDFDLRLCIGITKAELKFKMEHAAMHRLRSFYVRKLVETREALARLASLETELTESVQSLESCRACAPKTARAACRTCDETLHEGHAPPPLVAAVHDPI